MSKKIILIIIAIIIMVGIWWFALNRIGGDLANPLFGKPPPISSPSPSPTPTSPQTPKTFKFDRYTDLKVELEKVNPQVLDSDFE